MGILFFVWRGSDLSWTKNKWVRIISFVLFFTIAISTEVRQSILNKENAYRFTADFRLSEVATVRQIIESYESEKHMTVTRSVFDRSTHWKLDNADLKCDVCVLVMGESARRDFMDAYGGPWKNTNWMSTVPGKLFTNFNSASCATAPSLSVELYAPDPKGEAPWGDNIVSLAKKAGFETFWLSNQGQTGIHDSPVTMAGMSEILCK